MEKKVPDFWKAWLIGLEPSEGRRLLTYFSACTAESHPILVWPDERANALWLVEEGLITWKTSSNDGPPSEGGECRRGQSTPGRWFLEPGVSGVLLQVQGSARLWQLDRSSASRIREEMPRAFAILTRQGGPLEGLRGWKEELVRPGKVKARRWFSPLVLYLGWCSLPAFFFLLSIWLLGLGLAGGWLALGLGTLVWIERTARWLGESLEVRANRLIYLRTNLLRRTHRRWTARWEDIQSIEVSQIGWIPRFFGLSRLRVDTRSNASPLELPHWSRVSDLRRDLEAMRASAGTGAGRAVGLRGAWKRHGGKEGSLFCLQGQDGQNNPPKPERVVFRRHPVTWVLRTAPGWFPFLLGLMGILAFQAVGWNVGVVPGGLVALFGAGRWLWRWWDWVNDTYAMENATLYNVERQPFWLGITRKEISVTSLQTAEVEQNGLLPIFFDYGKVTLSSAGGGPALIWTDVKSPAEIQELVFALKKEAAVRDEDRKFQERWKEMAEAIQTWDCFKLWGLKP